MSRSATSLLGYALGALRRRKAKALALGGGLAFAVALVSAVLFLTSALRAEADHAVAAIPDVVVQRLSAGRPATVALSDGAKLEGIASVRRVRSRVWGYVFLPELQGNATVIGVPRGAPALPEVQGLWAEGRDRKPGAHEMVAGANLVRYLGVRVGDSIALPSALPSPSLTLVGTFGSSVEMYANDVILLDEDDARAVLDVPEDRATDFAIDVINPAEATVIARTVLARLPGTRVVERELLGRVYALAYGRRAGLVLAASLPAILALLVLAWDRASGLAPEERKEIAILKAVGWTSADVLWAKLWESLLVGAAATGLGILLAYAWVVWAGAAGLRGAIAGWSVLYPEGPLTPAVDVAQLLAVACAVLGPFAALSVVPAWRAASLDPMESMRG
ncbi:MAG TPA: FtsX-like permease family protein [Polyangiaceae bacterium]|jgi:ABC-type lipoprotein release transport system permease subunit